MTETDLDRLSVAEKDQLILVLLERVAALTEKVAELERRLSQNSRNSSKPPSADGLNKPKPKPSSHQAASAKPTGGQKGHPGRTLKKVAHPDRVEIHAPPSHCDACHCPLPAATVVETRQVFDIPRPRHEVTEHRVLESCCTCGKRHRGVFPSGVAAPVQYGPHIKATVVHLSHYHMMPVARTGELLGDIFALPMSDATVLAINEDARCRLAPTVAAMGEALKSVPVAHADETGMRVSRRLHWLHVVATTTLTWIGAHMKRGREAFDAFGILAAFTGTLVHDGWKPYRDLACTHALCNAHHMRELTFVFEEMGQPWAKRMIDLLIAAHYEVADAGGILTGARIAYFRSEYVAILNAGGTANPRNPPSGNRGRTRQNKAVNLLDRLRCHADDVWRFATDTNVPFSNNAAEQAVRMPKVKQKISGGFRTPAGLDTFCTIRSYLDTLRKQGVNHFHALILTFQGAPPQPMFR